MPIREATRWDRAVFAIRRDGVSSAVWAAGLVGFGAGILDASQVNLVLLTYVTGWLLLTIVGLALRQRRPRVWLLRLVGRRLPPGADRSPPRHWEAGQSSPPAPASRDTAAVLRATTTPDHVYAGGFRAMAAATTSPLVVTPCNPRDVSRPASLLYPVVESQWTGNPVTVDLRPSGPRVQLIRRLPGGPDANHTFASRDICYIAEVAAELLALGPAARPASVLPEHCVDLDLLARHDVVVLSGPDTNFWHAALFEAVASTFDQPRSSVPLAVALRDATAGGVPVYGSSDLFVRLRGAGRATALGRRDATSARLSETIRPTYGMVLAATNPVAPRDDPRWCVFLAGLRSLGTIAATLAFASVLRALRTKPGGDFWSLAPATDEPGAFASVAAMLVRATTVEAAAGPGEPRTVRAVPHDRPDPNYRDSYVVTGAEVLDTTADTPLWRPLTLDSFPLFD